MVGKVGIVGGKAVKIRQITFSSGLSGLVISIGLTLAGCDPFSTREIIPRPSEIRSLDALFNGRNLIRYTLEERLVLPGGRDSLLSSSRVELKSLNSEAINPDSALQVGMSILTVPQGQVQLQRTMKLRRNPEGLALSGSTVQGPRLFSLTLNESPPGDNSDSGVGELLYASPAHLLERIYSDHGRLGEFTVRRRVLGLDTVVHNKRAEEAWVIEEWTELGAEKLFHGVYRYGASGLLQADLDWGDLDWRTDNGVYLGQARVQRRLRLQK